MEAEAETANWGQSPMHGRLTFSTPEHSHQKLIVLSLLLLLTCCVTLWKPCAGFSPALSTLGLRCHQALLGQEEHVSGSGRCGLCQGKTLSDAVGGGHGGEDTQLRWEG